MLKRKSVILALAALALGAGAFLYPNSKERPQAQPKTAVASNLIAAAGRVEPLSEEVQVGAELDGKLNVVLVAEGQRVKRGQVLASLVNGDFAARVDSARANLRERAAALDRLLNGARPQERREALALVNEADAVLENARVELERRKGLLGRGAISRTEFDAAEREFRVAQARREAASERHSFVDAEARRDERMRAEADVERARAQLAEAQAVYEKTFIRSPLDGVVLRRKLKSGESVSADGKNPVLTLGDCSQLRVRVDVDETDVAKLRLGARAWVTAAAYGDRKFPGRIVRIGNILGRKNIHTDEPTERVDTKILETLVELDSGAKLPVGLRVDAFIEI